MALLALGDQNRASHTLTGIDDGYRVDSCIQAR